MSEDPMDRKAREAIAELARLRAVEQRALEMLHQEDSIPHPRADQVERTIARLRLILGVNDDHD